MIKFRVAGAVLIAMTLIPATARAGERGWNSRGGYGRGAYGGGWVSSPSVGAWGTNSVGFGRPAYSGYYFRTWNGATSPPLVNYGPAYCATRVFSPQQTIFFGQPPVVYPGQPTVVVVTPPDPRGTSTCRYHYGGAVRFGR